MSDQMETSAKTSYYASIKHKLDAPSWSALSDLERDRWRAGVGRPLTLGDALAGVPAGTTVAACAATETPAQREAREARAADPRHLRALGFGKLLLLGLADAIGGHVALPAERAAIDRAKQRAADEWRGKSP